MPLWLVLASIGMFIWSCTAVVDRFALHNKRVTSHRFYVAIPALLQLPLALVLSIFLRPAIPELHIILIAAVGGLLEIGLLYYLFVALSKEEVGRVFPLTSVSTIATLLSAWLLLGERPNGTEVIAIALLLCGGLVIAFKRSGPGEKYRLSKSIRPLLIATVFDSGYILILRYVFTESDFATGFLFSRVGFFIGGLIILGMAWPSVKVQWQKLQPKLRSLILVNQVVAFSGHAFYFSALAFAGAALVQSVLNAQTLFVFAIAAVLSRVNPALVGESIRRHDVVQKMIGIILIMSALYLLI